MSLLIALTLLGAQTDPQPAQSQQTPPQSIVPVAPPRLTFPIVWEAMAPLPYRTPPPISPAMSRWVAGELVRGKCPVPRPVGGRHILRVDVAVLISSESTVRASIPRAIDCPTVEQYAAGMVSSFARNNLLARAGDGSGWFRASVTFDWPA